MKITPRILGNAELARMAYVFVLSLAVVGQAKSDDDSRFAALQADAKKSFREEVTPFVETYCTRCHGQNKQKAGS